jgi:hypothetical protein
MTCCIEFSCSPQFGGVNHKHPKTVHTHRQANHTLPVVQVAAIGYAPKAFDLHDLVRRGRAGEAAQRPPDHSMVGEDSHTARLLLVQRFGQQLPAVRAARR